MRYGGTRFHIVLRVLEYALLLFLFFVLQDCIFSNLPLFGVKPLILPVCCAVIALAEGTERGGALGLACGVLCDIAIGKPPIGFTLLLTVLGLGIGWLGERLVSRNLLTTLLCALFTLLICSFFQTLNLLLFKGAPMGPLMRIAILQTLYSLLFVFPLTGIVRRSVRRGG